MFFVKAIETVVAQTQTTIIQKKAERDAQLNALAADRDRTRSVTDELEEFVRDIDKGGAALRKWRGHAFLRRIIKPMSCGTYFNNK